MKKNVFTLAVASAFMSALATTPLTASASYANNSDAQALVKELANEGLDAKHVQNILDNAKKQDRIIEAISKPAEGTMTWGEYRKIFIQDDRVQQGVDFYKENESLLKEAEEKFGVPGEIITAIIGVETRYGRHAGSWNVVDALATLGFDYPPRAKFFRKELKELFLLERDAGIDITKVKGSYAGAMGMPQFMPSSYREYAVDGNNDGKIDLMESKADIIHSVANYFKVHGWEKDLPVAARAQLSDNADKSIFSKEYKPSTTLAKANTSGAKATSCNTAKDSFCYDLPNNTKVAPLELDVENGHEYWLVTNNFYAITRYNHSHLYAMAVFQLSQAIADKMEN